MANISGRVLTHDFTSKFPDCRVQMIRHTLRTHTYNMCTYKYSVLLSLEMLVDREGWMSSQKKNLYLNTQQWTLHINTKPSFFKSLCVYNLK